MKRRLSGADSILKGGADANPMNLLNFYQMIKHKRFEQCQKCKAKKCPKFQPSADALDDRNKEVLNYHCQYCKCHCSYHFHEWYKGITVNMVGLELKRTTTRSTNTYQYKETPALYDSLSAPLGGTNERSKWDLAARAFLKLDGDEDGAAQNNTMDYEYEIISSDSNDSSSNRSSRSNSFNNSPMSTTNNMNGFSSPRQNGIENGHYNNNNISTPPMMYSMSSPFSTPHPQPNRTSSQTSNSPTKFHVISDDESSESELTSVQVPSAPINPPNFNALLSMMNGSFMSPQMTSSPPNRNNSNTNGISSPASSPTVLKSSAEVENKSSEPPPKKQKTKEKSTRELSYWASKSVPKDKEAVIKNMSADAQFKLTRDITKSKISWSDVDAKVVKKYEQKIQEKEEKLKEVTEGSNWFWIKECKLYFTRNKDGELIGWVELTSPQPKIENRFLREYGSKDFLMVKISKAFPDQAKNVDYERRTGIVRNFFDKGIWIGTVHYQFCFASATHIRSEKVFFHTNPKKLIAMLGDFSEIRNPTKYLARLGQPWSSTKATIELPLDKVEVAPDLVSESGKEFTDGCGEMAPDIIERIYALPAFSHIDKSKPLPSAIQIRWGPCKGVLMVNPSLPPGHVRFRKSMQKYKIENPTLHQRLIEVCQESKRYSSRLNKEFIPLLHALGVPDSVFVNLVQKQLDKIKKLGDNPDYIKISLDEHRSHFMTKLKLFSTSNFSKQDPYYAGLIWKDKQKMLNELKGLRLEVERSCRLLGVWDQSGKLQENQCYVTYRLSNDSVQLKGKVVVMKNPTVHLGDVRVLEAVECPELNHLENVIVFPVKGKRPIADTIGGGDLDGDMFFVTACPDIVDNVKEEAPADYPTPNQYTVRAGEDMLERAKDAYIIQVFEGVSMGKISNMYYTLADHFEDGPRNKNCLELSRLHARKVDSAKTGDIVRLTKELNELSKKVGNARFLEQSFGKIVDTKGIVGKLYSMIADAIKDIKEPKYDYSYIDPDLLVEGREKYTQEAKELLKQYNERVREIMEKNQYEDDEDRKRIHFEMLEEEYRQILWDGLGNSHDEAYKKASAWYEVCYKDKKSKQRSFPWVNIDVLTRIKNDRSTMSQKSRKRLAMSIPK